MGHISSKRTHKRSMLKDYEAREFSSSTVFSPDTVKKLSVHFNKISASEIEDGVIDRSELCKSMRIPQESPIGTAIFRLFDVNQDESINFREFLSCFSLFTHENTRQKLNSAKKQAEASFRMFSSDSYITYKDLKVLLASANTVFLKSSLTDSQIDAVLDRTFAFIEHDEQGQESFASLEQYYKLVSSNPSVLKWLEISINTIFEQKSKK